MTEFRTIKDWRSVWQWCDICGVERLFDDRIPYTRQMMKKRIREIVEMPGNMAFEIVSDKAKAGCFLLYRLKEGVYEVHILLHKSFRGKKGIELGKQGTNFALSLPDVNRLVSFVPRCLPECMVFARLVGWKNMGLLPMTWLKNGIEYAVQGVERSDPCLF